MDFGIDENLGYREKAQAYANKIELCRKELDSLLQKISAKRTEMSTLSKKTLADFEASIPRLENDIKNKTAQLNAINSVIEQRNADLTKEQESLKARYEKLESNLKDSYDKKEQQFLEAKTCIENMHKREHQKLDDKEKDLREREIAVQESFEINMDRKASLDDLEKKLKRGREIFEGEAAGARKDIFSQKEILEDMKRGVQNRAGELTELLKQAKSAKDNADAVTARISEVEIREKNLVVREDAIKRRSQELDEYHVKLVADNRKIDLRLEDLGKFEIRLQEREKNIKLAEEKIAKG